MKKIRGDFNYSFRVKFSHIKGIIICPPGDKLELPSPRVVIFSRVDRNANIFLETAVFDCPSCHLVRGSNLVMSQWF